MDQKDAFNYERMEKAIHFIADNFQKQPSLEEIAHEVHMSAGHFQKLFTDWAGVSPKKFLQYISIEHAKSLIQEKSPTLFDVSFDTGLSSTSRLHDLFVTIEGMTPAEYKSGGKGLLIEYTYAVTLFGTMMLASTPIGICYLSFLDEKDEGLSELKSIFPKADIKENKNEKHDQVIGFFEQPNQSIEKIKLHLKGTPFQLKVWESLLKIPSGNLTTYGQIAEQIQQRSASRAVGTAIGSNLVAYLIPCHRVIQNSGALSGYKWQVNRKRALIAWESATLNLIIG